MGQNSPQILSKGLHSPSAAAETSFLLPAFRCTKLSAKPDTAFGAVRNLPVLVRVSGFSRGAGCVPTGVTSAAHKGHSVHQKSKAFRGVAGSHGLLLPPPIPSCSAPPLRLLVPRQSTLTTLCAQAEQLSGLTWLLRTNHSQAVHSPAPSRSVGQSHPVPQSMTAGDGPFPSCFLSTT